MKYNHESGWIDGLHHCESPNFDDRPADTEIDLLVIHNISLPPRQYGGKAIEQLFTNALDPDEHPYFKEICGLKVSAHLLVRRTGEVVQYVPLTRRAWHAGVSEYLERTGCNDFSIGIELEGCDEEPYEAIQYTKLVELTHVIQQEWPAINAEAIVGHCDISPGRKTDPGESFNWCTYRHLIAQDQVDK